MICLGPSIAATLGAISLVIVFVDAQNELPNIFSGYQTDWFAIRSKQVTRVIQQRPNEGADNEWSVEEHFSLTRDLSHSVHTNTKRPEESYTLLAHSGRIYFAALKPSDGSLSCKLDHRIDHSTLFPWRHTKQQILADGRRTVPAPSLVLGVGALWLNALEKGAKCAVINGELECKLQDVVHNVELRLSFAMNPDNEVPASSRLRSARVTKTEAIHLSSNRTLLQDVVVDAKVQSVLMMNNLHQELMSKINTLLKVCEKATGDMDTLFPSLMRAVAESNQRNYYFSYLVSVFGSSQKPDQATDHYSIQEWFSHDMARETIGKRNTNNGRAEKIYHQFNYRQRASKQAVRFKVVQPDQCTVETGLEDPLGGLSKLSERKLELISRSANGEHKKNSALLVGLGALLMNAADLQNKREFANDLTKNNKFLTSVEWVADDQEAALQVHFYFRRRAYAEHNNDCQVGDLIRVEFKELVEASPEIDTSIRYMGGLDSDQRPLGRYSERLLLVLELLDFSTFLYPDDIDRAFKLPKFCAKALEQADLVEEQEEDGATSLPESSTSRTNDDDGSQESYGFPEIEQYLNLERDYIINAEWNYDNGTLIRISEYLMLDDNQDKEDRQLFSRLDVTRLTNSIEHFEMYQVFLRYATNTALRVDQSGCRQIDRLEELFESLSSDPVQCYGIDVEEELNANKHQFRVYGLGALWKLASRSPFVEFLGNSLDAEVDKVGYAEWRLADDPSLPDASVIFRFKVDNTLEPHAKLWRRMTLVEVRIDVSKMAAFKPVQLMKLSKIELKVGEANALHFILPWPCHPDLDRRYLAPMPKFPTFSEMFHAAPKKASFALNYNLVVDLEDASSPLQVLEVNKGSSGLGQVVVDGNGQNTIIWLLTSSDRALMQHSSIGSLCKELKGGLARFFNVRGIEHLISGGNDEIISESSNFLVANLWHLLSRRIEFESSLDTEPGDKSLQVLARRRYVRGKLDRHLRLIEWSLSNGHSSISFQFEHSHTSNKLSLYSVMLATNELQMRFMMDHVGHVASFETQESIGLPAECYHQVSSRAGGDNFPKLSALIDAKNLRNHPPYMHMRSTLTSIQFSDASLVTDEGMRYILVEEYLMRDAGSHKYRLRSRSLRENFDYLIFEDSKEFFDLSVSDRCSVDPPLGEQTEVGKQVDWIGENLIAVSLDGTAFYSPLNLWRIAESPAQKRTKVNEDQPDIAAFFDQSKLSDWFLIEQWQVEAALKNGVKLNYLIKFNQDLDIVSKQRHIALTAVQVDDGQKSVAVSVIDYGRQSATGYPDELSIPKGFGCRRSELFKSQKRPGDMAVMESLSPVAFDYEASLELADLESGLFKARRVFHSGWFGRCPKFWNLAPIGPLRVIHQRRHFVNGTKASLRRVVTSYDHGETINGTPVNQIRLFDEQTGSCLLKTEVRMKNELFGLDFGTKSDEGDASKYPIAITDAALGLLTTKMSGFELIQLYELNRVTTAVYELRDDHFELSPNLVGPVSIIRTFERKPGAKSFADVFFHSDVKIEAYLLGKARLTLNIKNLGFLECTNILKKAGAEDCHQSSEFELLANRAFPFHQPTARLRNFMITFKADSESFNEQQFEALRPRLERSFLETLLKLPVNLRSMQIGQLHLGFHKRGEHTTRVHAKFNLVETPSSIEYFVEVTAKDVGDSLMKPLGASKLLNSKQSCSNWCDAIDCIALSYCWAKSSCQVITMNMIQSKRIENNVLAYLEDKLRDDDTCTYYYAPGSRRRDSLSMIVEGVRAQIYGDQEGSKIQFAFHVGAGCNEKIQFEAIELEEVTGDMDLLAEEDGFRQSAPPELVPRRRAVLATLRTDSFIERKDLEDRSIRHIGTKLIHTDGRAHCQEHCQNCQLISYCNDACFIISNITDWQTFKQVLDSARSKEGCSIQSEDYLLDYHEFPDTMTPSNYVDLGQDLSLIECATMCHLQAGSSDCLSFDFCINPAGQTTCYLQNMHVVMDDFDRSIIEQVASKRLAESNNSSEAASADRCSHYSKSLLSDFERSPGKRFVQHDSVVFKGTQLDSCALICRRDDTCLAFEHCYFPEDQSTPNSCYIQRSKDQPEDGLGLELGFEGQKVEDRKECSIYRVKHIEEEFKINGGQTQAVEPEWLEYWAGTANRLRWLISGVVVVGCLFAALIVGAIVQIMYMVVTGRRIPVSVT